MGASSLAPTDKKGLHGTSRLLKAVEEAGASPMVGAEVSVEGGGHLVLLAEDAKGYRSLSGLVACYRGE